MKPRGSDLEVDVIWQWLAIRRRILAVVVHAVELSIVFLSPWRGVGACRAKRRCTRPPSGAIAELSPWRWRSGGQSQVSIARAPAVRRLACRPHIPCRRTGGPAMAAIADTPVISSAPPRSCMLAAWMVTKSINPSVSVKIWRLRPIIFLPAS